VQYGHKLNLATGKSGLILDVVVEAGNPADAERFLPMLDRHIARSGRAPRQTAADGGYASRANLTAAKARGVADVAFHKKCGIAVANMVKSPWVCRRLRNFRAGIEAGISCFKRAYVARHAAPRPSPGQALARARPLQGLHLVGGGGPQPGAARPPQTGVAASAAAGDSAAGQIGPPDPARYTIPSTCAATATRKSTAPARTTPPPTLLRH
jgi:IS5 family transposase